jgi:uncharacterized protein (TIGR02118 family)
MTQVRLSVYYPQGEGERFDHDYYRDHHVPLCQKTWGPAKTEIERGVHGPFVAAVHFTWDSQEAMEQAMASEGSAALQADVPNYTTITPQMQISQVVA